MLTRRVLSHSIMLSFAIVLAVSSLAQAELLSGWSYKCDAKPLGDTWADPDFTKLTDGDKSASNSAIFGGGTITVDISLPAPAKLDKVVAQVQRHNDNYKLTKVTVEALQAGQYVPVGENNEGFWGPTAQSSFILEIPVDVSAQQLRVQFHAASIVSIQEIELFGEPQSNTGQSEYSLAFSDAEGARASQSDADNDGVDETVLENPFVRLIFETDGGVCRSMVLKATGSELVGGDGRYGLLRDQLWSPKYSFGDRPYTVTTGEDPEGAWVELKAQGVGGMLSFTQITKRVQLGPDSPVVSVHYELLNDPNSQTDYEYGLWSHHFLGVKGQGATYFFPTTTGVAEYRYTPGAPMEEWYRDVARGWAAFVADNGVGLATTVDYKYLNCFYMWGGTGALIPTFEWRYNRLPVNAGQTLSTDVRLIPLEGLPRVDGVLGEVVGSIELEPTATGADTRITVRLQCPDPEATYTADIRARELPDGEWQTIDQPSNTAEAWGAGASMLQDFGPGAWVVNCVVKTDAGVLGEFERPLNIGDAKLAYRLEPLEERVGDSGESEGRQYAGHELSTEVETPHFKWAKPYYKGKLKALVLCDDRYSREVIELWQRLEMDFEYVKFYTTLDKEWLYHGDRSILTLDAAQRRLTEKLEQDYDVIVLSGLKWDHHFTPELRQTIAEKVKAGTGLVYIEPDGTAEGDDLEGVCGVSDGENRSLGDWSRWEPAAEHYITSGLPWDTLPRTRRMPMQQAPQGEVLARLPDKGDQPLIVAGALGDGRVVTLTYDTLTHVPSYRGYSALTPAISYRGDYNLAQEMAAVTWEYWEHWWALLTRCTVWASQRDSGIRFEGLGLDQAGTALTARIVGDIPADATLEVSFRDRFSALLDETSVPASASPAIPLPANLRAGRCFADLVLRDGNGASIAWAAASFDGATAPALKEVAIEKRTIIDTEGLWPEGQPWKRVFRSKEPFRLTCDATTVQPVTEPLTIRAILSDCHGRVLYDESKPVAPNSPRATFEASPEVLYNIGHRWDVQLRAGDRICDTAHAEVVVIPPRTWDRFTLTSWGGQHLWRCQYLFDSMRPLVEDLGLDVAMNGENEIKTGKVWWDYWQNIDHSFLGILSYMGKDVPNFMDSEFSKKSAEYAKTKDKQWLVRTPSLTDPTYRAQVADAITNIKMQQVSEFGGAYDYCMGDEMSLTYYTQYFDFDFGEHSLAAFREWLQERYASVADLNENWETEFEGWDSVMPMTLDEVKGRANAAPWAEFRDFMNDCLADYYKMVQDTIRETDPDAKCGLSGTQEPKPGNGMDWWQNSQAFSYYHSYNTGWSDEMRRSFQPATGVMCTPYRCGYWQAGQQLEYQNFWCLLHDTKGISAWTTPLFFYGDFSFSEAGRDTRANTREMKAGIWDTIRSATRKHDGIAIHYSHPSINAALLTNKDGHITKVRDAWVKVLEDLGLQYNFVSYAQIEDGLLNDPQSDHDRYKVLILPESIALSEKEVAEIKQFVEGGGGVIGDLSVGLMDAKCRKQPTGLLDDVFGIERTGDEATLPVGVEVDDLDQTIMLPAGEATIRANGATAHARVPDTDVPAMLTNRFGRGAAAYLNIDMAEFENERRFGTATEKGLRWVIAKALEEAGVRPAYPVSLESGEASHVEVIRYAAGPLEYLGVLRSAADEDAEVAKIALGQPRHVYDVRAGKYLGQIDTITAPMLPGDCRVYCLAPELLGIVAVSAPDEAEDGALQYQLRMTPGTNGERQIVRVTFHRPDGTEAQDYTQNFVVGDESVSGTVRFALNDPEGAWTVRVRPICEGDAGVAERNFTLAR